MAAADLRKPVLPAAAAPAAAADVRRQSFLFAVPVGSP
jgi:hypothetical protein